MMAALPEATNHSAALHPTESAVSSKPTDSLASTQQADTVKQKNLLSDNTHVSRGENYELTFKYGNGNFSLSAELSDFLHTRRTDLRKLDMGIYSSHGSYWETGRQLKINMTYTFDYGKKIQDRSTINAESDSKTSVLGM